MITYLDSRNPKGGSSNRTNGKTKKWRKDNWPKHSQSREYKEKNKEHQLTTHHSPASDLKGLKGFEKLFDERKSNAGPSNNANRKAYTPHKIGFKKLEEFLTEEPDQLVVRLLSAMSGFLELLHTPSLSQDYIVLIMRILSKMSECSFDSNKTKLLKTASTEIFLMQLTNFIFLLPLQTVQLKKASKYFWNDPDDFFQNLSNYCEMILHLSPSTACDILPNIIHSTISVIPQLENLSNKIQIFKSMQVKLDMCKEEMALKSKTRYTVVDESELEPPNNFREISLYPLPLELINPEKAFVRPNIVKGPYRNVDHYLDIQFRLLREDFVKPLREGISEYLHNDNKKPQNVKIYKNVKFISSKIVNAVCGVLVQLEIVDKKSYRMKLENSRSFMFGSLMCFTKNNFKSIIFGKIVDRKPELLQKGQLVVEFEPGVCDIEYNINYIMVESKVYFEPYYHVLKALKELSDSNFPMEKFIINVSTITESVQYVPNRIQQNSDDDYDDGEHEVPICRYLKNKLNETQYEAYQCAMNQSFSIIQGPPGTGKTFLGLQIVKSLLRKRSEWHYDRYPLLVVCFTNHALDQFLEGLLSTTNSIVRIGGQSKNKNLEPYNIRNMRKSDKRNARAFYEARDDVLAAQQLLQKCYNYIDIVNKYDGVVNILSTINKLPELLGTWFENVNPKEFQKWLFEHQEHFQEEQINIEMKDEKDIENNEDISNEFMEDIFEDPNEADFVELDNLVLNTQDISYSFVYIISIKEIEKEIQALYGRRELLNQLFEENLIEIYKIDTKLKLLQNSLKYLQLKMEEGKSYEKYELEKLINYELPHHIHPDDRWKLYFYWVELFKETKTEEIIECEKKYQLSYNAYEELREIEDIEVIRKKFIVGMTTTGAARLQRSLRALKSPIVVVEEAAEIKESHVVTSLTKDCKHLILIGDHQQLRPNTADYLMEKRYLLGISLFERMVRNNIHCNVLSVQHRMRPEIAKLIAPNIYPHLKNHESVNHFPPIRGVNSCMYFITHTNPEEMCLDNSKVNKHEIIFLLRFAKYLIQNGYKSDEITILAAYTGQMFAMFKERNKYELLKDVRICVLDNYQGEESKIILLSLVRNNSEGKIGFLSIENRVCVALSRAREGLYIMGNMDLLCSKSTIWPKIRSVLEEQNSLVTSLTLRCQIHYDKITNISNEADFFKVSEGGCDLICRERLICGHQCLSQCHTLNRDHNLYQCKEKCRKILCDNGHLCPKLCFEKCSDCVVPMMRKLICGHEEEFPCYKTEFICLHPISVELPCKHKVCDKPCYMPVEICKCPYPCDTRLDICGHSCEKKCHIGDDPDHLEYKCRKPCERYTKSCTLKHICPKSCFEECPDCEIVIRKERSCSHFFDVACSADVEKVECKKPCKKMLSCGHPCKCKCNEACGNCNVKVKKVIPDCGHEIEIECSKPPNRRYCKNNCLLQLQCGHKCKNRCNDICTATCMDLVDSSIPLPCGHSSQIPCSINNSNNESVSYSEILTQLSYCRHPCLAQLECGHPCSGSCGECYQGRIHKICSEDCGVDLICGHKCKVPCRQACPPCGQPCMYRCPHSKCKKQCGNVCTPCKEPCLRRCKHGECKSWCGVECSVPPCEVPCRKKLRCGHSCIGFCGEPCPPLCMICNREELLDFCLGYEEEEDSRFVLLQECNHVIESRGMKMWLEQNGNEINVKRCPKCRTPLTITKRFDSYIKESIKEISKIRLKFFGEGQENKKIQESLLVKIDSFNSRLKEVSKEYDTVCSTIATMLKPTNNGRKQTISKIKGQILTSKIQILENICKLFDNSSKPKTKRCIQYIDFLLARLIKVKDRMTSQEINDYDFEIKRLRRILQFRDIKQTYPLVLSKNSCKHLSNILYDHRKYDINNDENVKKILNELCKEMGGTLIVSDKELQDIVKAIGVKHGAWYKCRNGHPYAIGECGGAMQVSKCADCGAAIGGTNHALLNDNQHAGIDRANYAAWSEQANLGNYELIE